MDIAICAILVVIDPYSVKSAVDKAKKNTLLISQT